jgi:hypothetical protein
MQVGSVEEFEHLGALGFKELDSVPEISDYVVGIARLAELSPDGVRSPYGDRRRDFFALNRARF